MATRILIDLLTRTDIREYSGELSQVGVRPQQTADLIREGAVVLVSDGAETPLSLIDVNRDGELRWLDFASEDTYTTLRLYND